MPALFRAAQTFRARGNPKQWYGKAARAGVFLGSLYSTGAVGGALSYAALPPSVRELLLAQVTASIRAVRAAPTGFGSGAFAEAFAELVLLLILWLVGQSIIGRPAIAIIVTLRGLSLGLALVLLVAMGGYGGLWLDLLGVLPSNILTAGGLLLGASAGFLMAGKTHVDRARISVPTWILYHTAFLLAMAFLLGAGLFEMATIPRLLRWLQVS